MGYNHDAKLAYKKNSQMAKPLLTDFMSNNQAIWIAKDLGTKA